MAKLRKNLSLARELLQTKVVMMEANALANYRQQLLSNFNQHISAESILDDILPNERHYMLTYRKDTREVTAVQFFDENNMLVEESADGEMVAAHEPEENEQRVLFLELTGPVTRCGGMCSYGSMDMRDILLEYASDETVAGLVLITDTPGGTAFALHDFAQGMEAWNAAGKRSIQWIDGMSCSAGVACGCQCQKVIAMNPKDIVGCIGAMMAGFMIADGTVDQNGMRYVDITAEQTPDKNREFREAAEGNYKLLQEEVSNCCEDFLAVIERCRPQIKKDQRTGKTYEAGSVIGSLVDGIGDLNSAIHYCLTGEEQWSTGQTATSTESTEPTEPEDKCKPKDACDPEKKDKCKPKDGCPCNPEEDPEERPDEANNASGEQSLDNPNTENPMTQIEAQRIADKTGMTVEEVMAIANPVEPVQTEEPAAPAEPAEPAAQVEEPAQTEEPTAEPAEPAAQAEEPVQTEEPAAPAEPAEPAAQAEEPAQTEEPAAEPAAQTEEPVQTEEPAAPAEPAEPAAQAEEPAQAEETAEDPTLAALNAIQQQMAQMQSQFTALQQQHQQTEQQLVATQQQLQAARQETADLRAAAPAPAMPAAPAHSPAASTVATRINENMTAKEKLEAYKKRGEQLKRNR